MTIPHALVCAPCMPEFDRESGSRRIYDFIDYLRSAGWAVSFVSQHVPEGERYARMLQQRGVAIYHGFDTRVEQLIGATCPDLALLAFWNVAEKLLPVVRRLAPGTPILVDSIDLHFLRNARENFQRDSRDSLSLLNENFASEMLRELNVYAAADGVLAVSQKEADLINDLMNDPGLAHVVPDADDIPLSPLPFAARRGILFVGNYRHAPNVGAVEFLCREIIPRIDPSLLAEHPLSIVGNQLNETVQGYGRGLAHVKMVGWVPSVLPYLNQSRVKVIPLLFGAGTKRKLVQALLAGTPIVSTTIGIEGLGLQDGKNVLVADSPDTFARSVERLLNDESLWQRLACDGRTHIDGLHGREISRQRFLQAVQQVRIQPLKPPPAADTLSSRHTQRDAYNLIIPRIHEAIRSCIPAGDRILIVSKGDGRLLALDGYLTGHFPQADGGSYAGHHPGSGTEALEHLKSLQASGNEFLVFPATSFWWLDYYAELNHHLVGNGECLHNDDCCQIYRLRRTLGEPVAANNGASITKSKPRSTGDNGEWSQGSHDLRESSGVEATSVSGIAGGQIVSVDFLERARPLIPVRALRRGTNDSASCRKILVLGVYLANQPNTVDHVVAELGDSGQHEVTQRWIALSGDPPTSRVANVTVGKLVKKTPKFKILNELLSAEDLGNYDYILLADDDIVMPVGFLDAFIGLQDELVFALAQPARTGNSYIDHPIVEQQQGVLARRTMFVEIGPVVSFHRTCFDLVFPFDLTSPMGWGYENVWSRRLAERGLKMGIIDVVPVDHSLRKPVNNYSWAEADRQRKAYLAKEAHTPHEQCLRVLELTGFSGMRQGCPDE